MAIPNKPSYTHGSTGTEPGSSIDYQNGDPVDEAEFDYFINTEFTKIKSIIDALNEIKNGTITVASATDASNVTGTYKGNDIDSDGDGTVNSAENVTSTYKGNDIDSDGDGRVNAADDATTVKGNDIDTDGDGTVNSADTAALYKGNDIDSDGDGTVDDADLVQGIDIFHNALFGFESGIINSGNAAVVAQTELADQETLSIYRASFNKPGGVACPSGLDLIIAAFDGSPASEKTILAGDGATVYSKETGTPLVSYQNTTGSPQHIEIMIDNGNFNSGTGAEQKAAATLTGRVE